MGGRGSGTWYRGSTRNTCEETRRIDIRYLNRHRLLNPNRTGTLSWDIGGEPSGNINYTMYENTMILNFKWQRYGGEDWQSVKQSIWFDHTRCNYGGERKWFLCSRCEARVAVLYGADVLFLCRHCYQLPYASQGEDYFERLVRKANKISNRLDMDDDEVYTKPKHMHWKTFYHLVQAELAAEERMNNALLARWGYYL